MLEHHLPPFRPAAPVAAHRPLEKPTSMTLPVIVQHAPRFTPEGARHVAAGLFGLEGAVEALPSERDQNFHLALPSGEAFVLKISNAMERADLLDLQNAAMAHIAAHAGSLAVPRVVAARDGRLISEATGEDGRRHMVRMLTWVPGRVLATVKPHSEALLADLGRALGEMDRALAGFEHPAMRRDFPWDLHRTLEVRSELTRVGGSERRALLAAALDRFEREGAPRLGQLPRQVVHNDWNDHNVLVIGEAPAPTIGVLDFGDMLHSLAAADLAVCCAYAMLGKPDPVGAAAAIVGGYHERRPLGEHELAILFDLIQARLVISVVMAACQLEQASGNEYLQVSQRQVWSLLEAFQQLSPALAHYRFRDACGLPPCPQSAAIAGWLKERRAEFAPVISAEVSDGPVTVFDLSVGSLDVDRIATVREVERFSALVSGKMAAEGTRVGIGRYDEARLLYVGELFRHENNWAEENRSVHLGIDLFQPPGTPVFAPLAGRVHSVAVNAGPGDYGPTIVLEHRTDEGIPFWTLYGHLDEASLEACPPGRVVERGERLASIGSAAVNGGWPPHLHFQIIVDLLGLAGNFPGVAAPSEREVWLSLCPDPNVILGVAPETFPGSPSNGPAILARRRENLAPNMSVSYRRPLTIVRGEGQYLFDAEGRRFLDAVNNVPHVGHSNPKVVAAAARQLAVLDSNTRYLHPTLADYLGRLADLFPDPLRVFFIVNSGSEANELAIRLARAYTNSRGVVVVDGAYHGNTSSLVEISPYKFNGPGGAGCPPHVRVARMPDVYRGMRVGAELAGPERAPASRRASARTGEARRDPDATRRASAFFARSVAEAARDRQASEHGLAAFFCESLLSCGGQIVLPAGYLRAAYNAVRAAGGICVADEVQVGFGRVGTHFWGFETQGVVPDVVTLGKPIGNGFPLGAVVTTPEVAAAFHNGMEYFNTFGGSPVACAVGLAVLDVMRDERLQERALRVGSLLRNGLETLRHFPIVGDVRGLGLFLGIELVRDRATLEPAAPQADYVVNRLRDRGILVSTDGPLHNVIKIKPPMVFAESDADRLVSTLAEVLTEDGAQP